MSNGTRGTGTPIWHQGNDLRSSSTIDFTEGNAPLAYPDSFTRQISIDYEDDEIGSLNTAFRNMVAYLHQMAAGATQISAGELDRELAPKSQHDVLGNAFHQMTDYLQTMAATAIAGGDLRQEVQPRSERDLLGNAFQQMAFLRQIIGQVTEGSLHLEKASESLKQMSLQMAGDAQQASKQSHGISNNTQQVNRHVAAIAPQ